MSASTEFVTSLPFLGYKQRNAVLDSFFYDTASLTVEEKTKLSPLVDREGSIIVVPPSNSDRQIRHYKRALRFMNKEGPTIRAIAVAGVGSSVLGTAALARNIADALDTDVAGIITGYGLSDVAGIITGYGLSDVMTEAFGGWFVFSAADRIRYATEKFLERMRAVTPADRVPGDNDVATLAEILLAGPPALEYLVTHSKGSLVASHALRQYVDDLEGDDSPLFERLHITTLGAVVGLPTAFKNVKQYLGTLGVRQGEFESRRDARAHSRRKPSPQSRLPLPYERGCPVEWRKRRCCSAPSAETCARSDVCAVLRAGG